MIREDKQCSRDCGGEYDMSDLEKQLKEVELLFEAAKSVQQASTDLRQAAAWSFANYTFEEKHRLASVNAFVEMPHNTDRQPSLVNLSVAFNALMLLCESRATIEVKFFPVETSKAFHPFSHKPCGACSIKLADHSVSEQFTIQQPQKCFIAKCGHYFSPTCLSEQYFKTFQISKLTEENLHKQLLKTPTLFRCKECSTDLFFDEIVEATRNWLASARSSRAKFECLICCDDQLDREDESVELFDCTHIYCEDCLRSYIISRINEQKFKYTDMNCPSEGCGQLIHHLTVDRLIKNPANMQIFNRMIRLQLINLQLNEKNTKVATCPGFLKRSKLSGVEETFAHDDDYITRIRLGMPPGLRDHEELLPCPALFTFNFKTDKVYSCTVCKYKSCLNGCEDSHQKGSKRGKNCVAFKKWKLENSQLDKEVLAFFDKQTMCHCPQCKAIIIRSGGCNHMTCTMPQCGFEFCFKCTKQWICWRHLHYL